MGSVTAILILLLARCLLLLFGSLFCNFGGRSLGLGAIIGGLVGCPSGRLLLGNAAFLDIGFFLRSTGVLRTAVQIDIEIAGARIRILPRSLSRLLVLSLAQLANLLLPLGLNSLLLPANNAPEGKFVFTALGVLLLLLLLQLASNVRSDCTHVRVRGGGPVNLAVGVRPLFAARTLDPLFAVHVRIIRTIEVHLVAVVTLLVALVRLNTVLTEDYLGVVTQFYFLQRSAGHRRGQGQHIRAELVVTLLGRLLLGGRLRLRQPDVDLLLWLAGKRFGLLFLRRDPFERFGPF